MILGILSMFVVVPYISSNQTVYGIYSACISLNVFMTYADIGFVGAGQKFASEMYAKGDLREEIGMIGFVSFVLFCFSLLFLFAVLILAMFPMLLFKNLGNAQDIVTASTLLYIVAGSAPLMILQRAVQLIFGVRLEDYIFQRIIIVGSVLKLVSVLYFFSSGKYDITGYFLFMQIVNLGAFVVCLAEAKRRYSYSLRGLLMSFRYSKIHYHRMKTLAFSTFYATIAWILFFELDSLVIAKVFGPTYVAQYAVAMTILIFLRTAFGTIYGPFQYRFNHFVGLRDDEGLRDLVKKVIIIMLPFVLFPIVAIIVFSRPLLISWVGPEYLNSVDILQLLVLGYALHFISQPTSILLIAKEKNKSIVLISSVTTLIYWCGILLVYTHYGVLSFAIFKFAAFWISGIFYLYWLLKFLEIDIVTFGRRYLLPIVPAIILVVLMLTMVDTSGIQTKSTRDMLTLVLWGGAGALVGSILYVLISKPMRQAIAPYISSWRQNN
jgi:O-antigen/teichoic acid export membrane protein